MAGRTENKPHLGHSRQSSVGDPQVKAVSLTPAIKKRGLESLSLLRQVSKKQLGRRSAKTPWLILSMKRLFHGCAKI
jgi:hypothetical protein